MDFPWNLYISASHLFRYCLAVIFIVLPVYSHAVSFEYIIYLNNDGKTCLSYSSSRSKANSYGVYYPKSVASLDEFLYINPPSHHYDVRSDREYNILKFNQGSYAILEKCELGSKDDKLTIDEDGVYTYTNWNKNRRPVNGHVGLWNSPENFTHLAVAYEFPGIFTIVDYRANVKGTWKLNDKTLSFFAENANDVIYTIRYKPVAQEMLAELKTKLKGKEGVKLNITKGNLNFQLNETILFDSGSARLNKQGLELIEKIAGTLKSNNAMIDVGGHTDNIAIKGGLADRYFSNWELSAARSIAVVKALIANRIDPARLQASAFSQYSPIADNGSASGRAQNRRIEITVIHNNEKGGRK